MTSSFKLWPLAALALALLGCGGTTDVDNPAGLRFFAAYPNTEDVRVNVGGVQLLGTNGGFDYGNVSTYRNVPSGSVDISVTGYVGQGTSYGTLTGQNLDEGNRYTLVGTSTTSSTGTTTSRVTLYEDSPNLSSGSADVRIINGATSPATIYVTLRRVDQDANSPDYFEQVAYGGNTGYSSIYLNDATEPVEYILAIYRSDNYTNPVASEQRLTLSSRGAKTIFLYNPNQGTTRVLGRVVTDFEGDTTGTGTNG